MKVLLLKDVPGIGNKGQIKEVKEGYALNLMIPRKLAVPADIMTVKNFNTAVQAKKDKEAIHEELIKKTLFEIKDKTVLIKAKVNEKGKLFKSIHGEEIVDAFEKEYHLRLDESWLPKNFSLKEMGESIVTIDKSGMRVEFVVKVVAE